VVTLTINVRILIERGR